MALVVAAAVLINAMLAAPAAALVFPRDQGAHSDTPGEWWRCVGHLASHDGRRFDFAATFFRFSVRSNARASLPRTAWTTHEFYSATFAIVDERDGRFVTARRFARDTLGLGAARADRLGVRIVDWTLDGSGARDARSERVSLQASDGGVGVDLIASSRKPAVAFHDSNAYALPSMRTSGFATVRGERIAITGTSWFDHSYGTNRLPRGAPGWDRFAIQLDDGRELWIERTRYAYGTSAVTRALLVDRAGDARELPHDAYTFGAHGPSGWRSRATGARYPNIWAMIVPSARLMLSFEPVVANQEIVAAGRGASYWNGAVDVYDITPGTPGKRLGAGYAELTGYARPLRL